jgi:hypothetical protein
MDRRAKLARPWTMAAFTLIVLAAIAGLATVAWRGHEQDDAGRPGTVEVTGCVFVSYALHGDIYRCGGEFSAADQSFTIPYVTFTNSGRIDTGRHVTVRVADRDATTGTETTESRARLLVTLGGAILLAAALAAIWPPWLKARRRLVSDRGAPARKPG